MFNLCGVVAKYYITIGQPSFFNCTSLLKLIMYVTRESFLYMWIKMNEQGN